MALVKCPDCGQMISERAERCPSCGCPAEYYANGKKTYFPNNSSSNNGKKTYFPSNSSSNNGKKTYFPSNSNNNNGKKSFFSSNSSDNNGEKSYFSSNSSDNNKKNSNLKNDSSDIDNDRKSFETYVYHNIAQCKDLEILQVISCSVGNVLNDLFKGKIQVIYATNADDILKCLKLSMPCVIVGTALSEGNVVRTFKFIKDGIEMEFCRTTDSFCFTAAPTLFVYAKTSQEVVNIVNSISNYFKQGHIINLPFKNDLFLPFPLKSTGDISINEIDSSFSNVGINTIIYKFQAGFVPVWVNIPPLDVFISDCELRNIRLAQIALYASHFCSYNKKLTLGSSRSWGLDGNLSEEKNIYNTIDDGIRVYSVLTRQGKLIDSMDSIVWGTDFKILKNALANRAATPELVQKVLLWHSQLYTPLYECIISRTNSDVVKNSMYKAYQDYKLVFDTICNYFGLPQSMGVKHENFSVLNPNMRSFDGLKFIFNALSNDALCPIQNIIQDYQKAVQISANEGYARYIEIEEADEKYRANHEGRGILGDIATSFIGTKLANRTQERELRKLNEANERRNREQQEREKMQKMEAARKSQYEWKEIQRINMERRRKGLPELPYPDRFYY